MTDTDDQHDEVTFRHIGLDVTWTDRGHGRTGRLHQLPEAGTPSWFKANGKAVVLTTYGWDYVHPSDLRLAKPRDVSE